MYYLQSRYYDSKICRFISPDSTVVLTATPIALTDKNLYAYCDNNPVTRIDGDGEFWTAILIGAAVGIVSQYIGDVYYNLMSGKEGIDLLIPSSSFVDYIAAGASGALATTGIGLIGSKVANAVIDGTAYLFNQLINGEDVNTTELAIIAGFSFITSGKGINSNKMRGIYQHSKNVLETAISPKKIAMYTAKIVDINKTITKEIGNQIVSKVGVGMVKGLNDRYNPLRYIEGVFGR